MTRVQRIAAGLGLLVVAGIGVVVWRMYGPSDARVRQTIITTVQEEAPESFYVTGRMQMTATVEVDSSAFLTPGWLTVVLRNTNPAVLPLAHGSTRASVRVPGRVSYGFSVHNLTPEMIDVRDGGEIRVTIPALEIYSVEPDLAHLQVKTASSGWMQLFSSGTHTDVRKKALAGVEGALRAQAQSRLDTATQPRVNTARALRKLITPPLQAAGIQDPQFHIQVGEDLVLSPRSSGG